MPVLSNEQRSQPFGAEGLLPWLALGILVGILFLAATQLDVKWFLSLFLGTLILALSLVLRDKKSFYLALLVLSLAVTLDVNLAFQRSSEYHSTYGFAINFHDLALLALYGIWLGRGWLQRSPIAVSTRGLLPIAAFFVSAVISVLLAGDLLFGAFDLFALLGAIAVFVYASSEVRTEHDLRVIVWVLLATVAIEGLLAIGQDLTHSTLGLGFLGATGSTVLASQAGHGLDLLTRVGGTMGHPNALALFFDLVLPLGVSLLLGPFRCRTKLLLAIPVGLGLVGLALTLSRGGLGAAVLGCLTILFLWLKRRFSLLRGLCLTLLLAGFAFVLVFFTSNPISDRFRQDDYRAALARIPLMQVSAAMIRHNPFFGVGLNNYTQVAPKYDQTSQWVTSWWNPPVHNEFLYIAGETGLAGLISYVVFLLVVFRALRDAVRSANPLVARVGLGIAIGLAVYLVNLQVEFDNLARNALFWFLAGVAVSLGRLASSTESLHDGRPAL